MDHLTKLYIHTVICNIVRLRNHGNWLPRHAVAGAAGAPALLDFRKADPQYWGRTMQARALAIKDLSRDVFPVLQYAQILLTTEGGLLLHGFEISSRGVKSKAIQTKQTWWCVDMALQEAGYAMLERMNPRTSTGFSVNDDD